MLRILLSVLALPASNLIGIKVRSLRGEGDRLRVSGRLAIP